MTGRFEKERGWTDCYYQGVDVVTGTLQLRNSVEMERVRKLPREMGMVEAEEVAVSGTSGLRR